jgi:hypothetical protein
MTNPNVTAWVPVETLDTTTGARIRGDYGTLHVDGLGWSYLGPSEWAELKAKGDAILAGMRGRKMLTLAVELAEREEVDGLARGCFSFPDKMPPIGEWTDEQWAHVARVLLHSPAHFGLLLPWWEAAGKALAEARGEVT